MKFVKQRVDDALVRQTELRAEVAGEIERLAGVVALDGVPGVEREIGREDGYDLAAGLVLGAGEDVLHLGQGRPDERIDPGRKKGGDDVGDALVGHIRLDQLILGRAGVRPAEKPVHTDHEPRDRNAADRGPEEIRHEAPFLKTRAAQ
ncbi:MAG: hypothetical protein ABIF71_06150 [Planctomycetota bacterium]